jgi:hypothetical protein
MTGILRSLLSMAGGIAVGKGYIDSETMTTISGAVVTLFSTGWSVAHHVTANNPNIKTIP